MLTEVKLAEVFICDTLQTQQHCGYFNVIVIDAFHKHVQS